MRYSSKSMYGQMLGIQRRESPAPASAMHIKPPKWAIVWLAGFFQAVFMWLVAVKVALRLCLKCGQNSYPLASQEPRFLMECAGQQIEHGPVQLHLGCA